MLTVRHLSSMHCLGGSGDSRSILITLIGYMIIPGIPLLHLFTKSPIQFLSRKHSFKNDVQRSQAGIDEFGVAVRRQFRQIHMHISFYRWPQQKATKMASDGTAGWMSTVCTQPYSGGKISFSMATEATDLDARPQE